MSKKRVYVYGMTVLSTIHRFDGGYPVEDTYGEIVDTRLVSGGEGGNAAVLLSMFGCEVTLDGGFLGTVTREKLPELLEAYGVDCSLLQVKEGFEGWKDVVLCSGESRTVLGWFQRNFSKGNVLWSEPNEEAIKKADCVVLDPFFGNESRIVAELCWKYETAYATIDCKYDDEIASRSNVLICSKEFINREYPDADVDLLLKQYLEVCEGLVVFTFGAKRIVYGRRGEFVAESSPYRVEVVDTLAAGDSFRAGVVYAVLEGMSDEEIVRYGAATAAAVCGRFPSIYPPPRIEEIKRIVEE